MFLQHVNDLAAKLSDFRSKDINRLFADCKTFCASSSAWCSSFHCSASSRISSVRCRLPFAIKHSMPAILFGPFLSFGSRNAGTPWSFICAFASGRTFVNTSTRYIAGLSIRVIAEILAWSEDQVERIIRRYVARAAATKEAIRRLNEAQAFRN